MGVDEFGVLVLMGVPPGDGGIMTVIVMAVVMTVTMPMELRRMAVLVHMHR